MDQAKSLLESMEKDFVSKLSDWFQWVENAKGNVQGLKDKDSTAAGNVVHWLQRLANSISSAQVNVEYVTDILNARKASLEVKRIVVESWPRKAFVDRIAYISTALFGIGGTPFALTAGRITDASLLVAGLLWGIAGLLMI